MIKYHILQKQAELSNTKAAEYLGVNISTIKRWRNGTIKPPKMAYLALEYRIMLLSK